MQDMSKCITYSHKGVGCMHGDLLSVIVVDKRNTTRQDGVDPSASRPVRFARRLIMTQGDGAQHDGSVGTIGVRRPMIMFSGQKRFQTSVLITARNNADNGMNAHKAGTY